MVFSDGKGMVVGISSLLVVYVGIEVLKKGGNVMDVCLIMVLIGMMFVCGLINIFKLFIFSVFSLVVFILIMYFRFFRENLFFVMIIDN